jgi:hypothetical protein
MSICGSGSPSNTALQSPYDVMANASVYLLLNRSLIQALCDLKEVLERLRESETPMRNDRVAKEEAATIQQQEENEVKATRDARGRRKPVLCRKYCLFEAEMTSNNPGFSRAENDCFPD